MPSRAVLSMLLVATVGTVDAQPAGISEEMLRMAEYCGESFFHHLYEGDQASVACEQGDPKAKGRGEFMFMTSTRNASMAMGTCIESFHPKLDWRKYPVDGKYLEGYSAKEGEIFHWLSSVADCKAQRMAKRALDASPDDIALRRTFNLLRGPSLWPPKCETEPSEAAPAR